jgi:putative DNA primase/helicase
VACFVAENSYKPSATKHILLKNLYADYRTFCVEDGTPPLKKMNFKKRLEANGFPIEEVSNLVRVCLETANEY